MKATLSAAEIIALPNGSKKKRSAIAAHYVVHMSEMDTTAVLNLVGTLSLITHQNLDGISIMDNGLAIGWFDDKSLLIMQCSKGPIIEKETSEERPFVYVTIDEEGEAANYFEEITEMLDEHDIEWHLKSEVESDDRDLAHE